MLVGLVALFRKGKQMELEPRNRWIGVDLSFDKKEDAQSAVILPEEYKPSEAPHKAVSVKKDPEEEYRFGDVIVVPTHVIREIVLRDETFYLVERNHVMARIT